MIKEYLQCIRIEAVRHANMLGNIIADLPFYKEKENESREKASFLVTGELLFFLWKIIKIYAYVVVFMYVPKLVFQKLRQWELPVFQRKTALCFLRWFLPAW